MHKTLIIAEAGVNHNGSVDQAKKLIDVAAESGADYVKFQTFKADKIVSSNAVKAFYQKKNSVENDDRQLQMLKKLELDFATHKLLIDYCKKKNIKFLSTPFDEESLLMLVELGIEIIKIPSGEITNFPFLRIVGRQQKPVILSTGMSRLGEIETALEILLDAGLNKNSITILHCNTQYPTPMQDVNLKAMNTIATAFEVNVGYSDHTLGIEVPIAAVTLGATVVEKHFTLDRNLPGPDHAASLEPEELKQMVRGIRNVELALGSSIKYPSDSEIENISIVRKSIHLAKSKKLGQILSSEDLVILRPGDGISPLFYEQVLNSKINKDLPAGYKLSWSDLY